MEFAANEKYLVSIDNKADEMKDSVVNSPNLEIPNDYVCYYISEKMEIIKIAVNSLMRPGKLLKI